MVGVRKKMGVYGRKGSMNNLNEQRGSTQFCGLKVGGRGEKGGPGRGVLSWITSNLINPVKKCTFYPQNCGESWRSLK